VKDFFIVGFIAACVLTVIAFIMLSFYDMGVYAERKERCETVAGRKYISGVCYEIKEVK